MTNEDGSARIRPPHAHLTLSALVLALALLISWRAVLAAEPAKRFNLPAQDLSSALITFGHQSGVQTLFGYDESEDIDAIRSSSVVGEFTVEDALTRLLKGTGLEFRLYAPGKIAVFRPKPTQAESPTSPETELEPTSQVRPIDEVQVTGTRLRGALDVVAPTVILAKRELRRSTFATVQDSLYSLPLNSLSGPREDWGSLGNAGFGAGVNLRHLGASATLVLVNGHRQPASGEEGAFTDVSNIPWSAVERIEVLPDGSSALYGADAIAGVVNIIMREDLDGVESQARFTAVPGGANELQVSQMIGKRWTSGSGLLAYQYSERAPLAAAERDYAANANKKSLGGTDHRSYYGGNIIDPITLQPVLGIPATGVSTASDYSSSINLDNQFEQYQLLPNRQAHSIFFTGTRTFGARWAVRADGRYGLRETRMQVFPATQLLNVPRSNPFFVDPFPDRSSPGVLVAYNFMKDFGGPYTSDSATRIGAGAITATASLGSDWRLALSHSAGQEQLRFSIRNSQNPAAVLKALSQTDPTRAFNPFGRTNPDVIASIRQTLSVAVLSEVATTTAVVSGTMLHTAAGPTKLAMGAERRREAFDTRSSGSGNPVLPEGTTIANRRYIGSVFAEVSAPLIGNPTDPRAVPRLEVSAACRMETYSDFGRTLTPRLGVKWTPFDQMKLRASWGRSFRAPTLADRDTSRNVSGIASLVDPKSPSGRSVIVGLQGNDPEVREETAATWTSGVDWVPTALADLKLSLTYFGVKYGDRIGAPARNGPFEILVHEEQWASAINRRPTQAQIDAICQRSDFVGPETCAAAQPTIIVDLRKTNLSETEVRGLDADIGYKWNSGVGSWRLHLLGTYLADFRQRSSSTSPAVDVSNTVRNPPALRARALGEWSQHPSGLSGFRAAAAFNYTNSYRDAEVASVRSVRASTTLDLQLGYRTPATEGWLAGVDVTLNAVNVSNKSPPFVNREFGYDVVNAQPIGRTISLEFRKSW